MKYHVRGLSVITVLVHSKEVTRRERHVRDGDLQVYQQPPEQSTNRFNADKTPQEWCTSKVSELFEVIPGTGIGFPSCK